MIKSLPSTLQMPRRARDRSNSYKWPRNNRLLSEIKTFLETQNLSKVNQHESEQKQGDGVNNQNLSKKPRA